MPITLHEIMPLSLKKKPSSFNLLMNSTYKIYYTLFLLILGPMEWSENTEEGRPALDLCSTGGKISTPLDPEKPPMAGGDTKTDGLSTKKGEKTSKDNPKKPAANAKKPVSIWWMSTTYWVLPVAKTLRCWTAS